MISFHLLQQKFGKILLYIVSHLLHHPQHTHLNLSFINFLNIPYFLNTQTNTDPF